MRAPRETATIAPIVPSDAKTMAKRMIPRRSAIGLEKSRVAMRYTEERNNAGRRAVGKCMWWKRSRCGVTSECSGEENDCKHHAAEGSVRKHGSLKNRSGKCEEQSIECANEKYSTIKNSHLLFASESLGYVTETARHPKFPGVEDPVGVKRDLHCVKCSGGAGSVSACHEAGTVESDAMVVTQ